VNHTDPFDDFDLREYRDAVAKFVRLMIRARVKAQRQAISQGDRERWGLGNIASDPTSLERLLLAAAAAYDRLWREFIGPAGSGGIHPDDPLAKLKEQVVHFMFETPPSDLLAQLRRGEQINWGKAAKWECLSAIRDGLDSLPTVDSTRGEESECPIVLSDRGLREVTVNGRTKQLTLVRWNVIEALVENYPNTMTKDQLVANSGHTDAVNILKRLMKGDDDWAAVIKLAGSTGGGYGIVRTNAD